MKILGLPFLFIQAFSPIHHNPAMLMMINLLILIIIMRVTPTDKARRLITKTGPCISSSDSRGIVQPEVLRVATLIKDLDKYIIGDFTVVTEEIAKRMDDRFYLESMRFSWQGDYAADDTLYSHKNSRTPLLADID